MGDEISLSAVDVDDENFSVSPQTPSKKTVFSCDDRTVIADDAFNYLSTIQTYGTGVSVFTSMPDISELPTLFHGYLVTEYKAWFTKAAKEVLSHLDVGSYAIFLQSDVRMMNSKGDTFEWIDKSHLIACAADDTQCTMVWHKLVLTSKTLEKRSTGRPGYSHLICFVKNPSGFVGISSLAPAANPDHNQRKRLTKREMKAKRRTKMQGNEVHAIESIGNEEFEQEAHTVHRANPLNVMDQASAHMVSHRPSQFSIPDIFYRGEMLWSRGIGLDCSYVAVMFLKEIGKCHTIVDPFVGQGTVLAMANALGLKGIGIEISRKRCRKAFACRIKEEDLALISPSLRIIEADVLEERRALRQEKESRINMTIINS